MKEIPEEFLSLEKEMTTIKFGLCFITATLFIILTLSIVSAALAWGIDSTFHISAYLGFNPASITILFPPSLIFAGIVVIIGLIKALEKYNPVDSDPDWSI